MDCSLTIARVTTSKTLIERQASYEMDVRYAMLE